MYTYLSVKNCENHAQCKNKRLCLYFSCLFVGVTREGHNVSVEVDETLKYIVAGEAWAPMPMVPAELIEGNQHHARLHLAEL